jgi:CspA family cold shock protein
MPVGTVKWYDPEKGFGFVAREDGGGDLFLHHSMVGPDVPAEGDRLSFTIGYGLKGERAEDVHILERSGNPPRASRSPGGNGGGATRQPAVDPATLPRLEGVVRRFDPERGFGFISAAGAPADVFFHGSAVVGSAVSQGDAVEFRLGQGLRGPRAQEVRLLQRR